MKLLLPYIFIFIIIFNMILRRGSTKQEQRTKAFWDKELKANSTRKKDISLLNYITIPDNLPQLNGREPEFDHIVMENKTLTRRFNEIESLKDKKILNLSTLSNTDLKLEYGAANLTALSEYDENYSLLIKNLASIGHELINLSLKDKAIIFLEDGIELGTDIKSNYFDLASLYLEMNDENKFNYLIDKAKILNSINKDIILEKLLEMKETKKIPITETIN